VDGGRAINQKEAVPMASPTNGKLKSLMGLCRKIGLEVFEFDLEQGKAVGTSSTGATVVLYYNGEGKWQVA
jgi:hypothetical protein